MLTTLHKNILAEGGGLADASATLMRTRTAAMVTRSTEAPNPFLALVQILHQLAELLVNTSDEHYVQQPVGVIASSLGGHVRHCLDHFAALLNGAEGGSINYDHRERGTNIETDRKSALVAIEQLQKRLHALDRSITGNNVYVTALISGDGTSMTSISTVGRELVFVLSHTIHHNALIAAICKTLAIPLPERFGYAPATIAHLARSTCAR